MTEHPDLGVHTDATIEDVYELVEWWVRTHGSSDRPHLHIPDAGSTRADPEPLCSTWTDTWDDADVAVFPIGTRDLSQSCLDELRGLTSARKSKRMRKKQMRAKLRDAGAIKGGSD